MVMIERASVGAPHGRSAFELGGGARRAPGQGQLERALDGRLAGLVRAADDGQAGRQLDVEGAIAPEVAAAAACGSSQRDLVAGEEQTAEPERVALLGGLGGRAGRLELGDAGLEVADERAGDRVRRRQRSLGQGRHRDVADADLEEGRRQGDLDLVEVEVEVVAADADQPDVEDEVGVGAGRQAAR